MKTATRFFCQLLALLVITLISCNGHPKVDLELEKKQVLKLHHAQRDYHFNKDSIAFANQLSENFISVNKGIINSPNQSETISRYHNYFTSVAFLKWDDVSEPIIKFSDDGTMAYTIVDKIVAVSQLNENSEIVESQTHFVWTAIYRKYKDQWKIDCVTSTNKPLN
ncbi:MAG: hypothetical protein AAFX55_10580 [Bacteroidota bacterium]